MERGFRRLKEFPVIGLEQIEGAVGHEYAGILVFGEDNLHQMDGMDRSDPHLFEFVDAVAKGAGEYSGDFKKGAHFVFMILRGLPRVSVKSIKSYRESMSIGISLAMNMGILIDDKEISDEELEKFREAAKESEIAFPLPYQIGTENELLSRFLHRQHPAFTLGGTIVYQLKKAQFESRKLTKQLFPAR